MKFALLFIYGVLNWIDVHVLFFWHAVARYFSDRLIEHENILVRRKLRLMMIFLLSNCFFVFDFRRVYFFSIVCYML